MLGFDDGEADVDGNKLGWLVGLVDEEGFSDGSDEGDADFDGSRLG